MTVANARSQLKAKSLGPGKHLDGQGLMLVKSKKDAGKWMLRLTIAGRRREMGLGRWLSHLSVHVLRKVGKTVIENVDQHIPKQTLEPIWHEKADTARKAINRLNLMSSPLFLGLCFGPLTLVALPFAFRRFVVAESIE